MIRIFLGILAFSLITAPPLAAQVYQWVDKNGVKHYSNSPPPEGAADVREYNEVKSGVPAETPGEGEDKSGSAVEAAGEEDETAQTEPADDGPESTASGTEGPADTEVEETSENPTTGRAREGELVEQETDRLEVKMAQLNRRLEEAQTARDRGSSYDVEQWNKQIEQIQSEIEKEKGRSEARIEQIRKKTGSQP